MGFLTNAVDDREAFASNLKVEEGVGATYMEIMATAGKEEAEKYFQGLVREASLAAYDQLPKQSAISPRSLLVAAIALALGLGAWRISSSSASERNASEAAYASEVRSRVARQGLVSIDDLGVWTPVGGTTYDVRVKDLVPAQGGAKLTLSLDNHRRGEPLVLTISTYDDQARPIGTARQIMTVLGSGVAVANTKAPMDGARYASFSASDQDAKSP